MALTESKMMGLGTPAPEFSLPNTDLERVSKVDFDGKPLLIVFMCNHCPYVKHIADELTRIGNDYQPQGVAMVGIQSNDAEAYPDDSPEMMKQEVINRGYTFAYLYDESQQVAKNFGATCTPDIFLFDAEHCLVYRGRLDETRPTRIESGVYDSKGNEPHGKDLRAALDAVLAGEKPAETQHPSVGCNIKWKPSESA